MKTFRPSQVILYSIELGRFKKDMHRLKILLLSGLLIACLADDANMNKHAKAASKEPSNHKDHPTTEAPKPKTNSGISKVTAKDAKVVQPEAMEKMNEKPPAMEKMNDKLPSDIKQDDMKSSATVGLGFYAGVVPFGYPSYTAYPYYRYYPRPYWGYPYPQTSHYRHYYPWHHHRHHRHFY